MVVICPSGSATYVIVDTASQERLIADSGEDEAGGQRSEVGNGKKAGLTCDPPRFLTCNLQLVT